MRLHKKQKHVCRWRRTRQCADPLLALTLFCLVLTGCYDAVRLWLNRLVAGSSVGCFREGEKAEEYLAESMVLIEAGDGLFSANRKMIPGKAQSATHQSHRIGNRA